MLACGMKSVMWHAPGCVRRSLEEILNIVSFSDLYSELNALGMSAEYAGMRPTSAAAGEIERQVQILTYPGRPNGRLWPMCAK